MKTTPTIKKLFFAAAIMLGSFGGTAQVNNTRYGTDALPSNNGVNNTVFGYGVLKYNDYTGTRNTAMGAYSLSDNISGSYNTSIGNNTMLRNQEGSYNTAVGNRAMWANTIGYNNTVTGSEAMYNNISGNNNSAYGIKALYYNSNGYNNSAFGVNAMYSNGIGLNNSAFGNEALRWNYSGWDNVAMGVSALYHNTSGYQNTSVGAEALYTNETGIHNTALGKSALRSNTASYNTAVGTWALFNNTSGTNNTVIGYNSGIGIISGSRNTIIGANVTGLPSSLSNTIILADGNGNQRLYIDNTGKTRIGEPSLTMPGTYRLYVKDGILTEKVVIAVANSTEWADYVFAPEYKLMPLKEVAQFVKTNNHLPNVPSADEVVKAGLNLGQMDAKLLEKIEELTLYLIEQNSKNEALLKEVDDLKTKMAKIEMRKARR